MTASTDMKVNGVDLVPMLTFAGVAKMLRVTTRTVKKLTHDRKLAYHKFRNGTVRFDIHDVEAYKRASRVAALGEGK